ncbi:hypothetical protein RP20_CCG024558 [Aedes albopictus]|nr:hypothetical protein RP20_CCG024558 [Aedes albopictus]
MNENLAKICRICLTEGSRHIFHKTVTNDALYNVSSLNRISEKLRYVTLLKIDEMENLPPMICDLCIVQLNVAYNFKRQATESDTKLRQYLIENGIDIMKDIRALPAVAAIRAPPTTQTAVPERLLSNRTNQRINSTSSSSIFEVPQSTSNHAGTKTNERTYEPRLVPIRIKVETPETVEQSSETGDLLSNSTISPLSSVTAGNGVAPVSDVTLVSAGKTNSTVNIVVESSPSSSKNSGSSDGRESAMVIVDSRNISMQGDEDYVQNILGSNSSLSTNASKSVEKVDLDAEKPKKDKHVEDHEESPQERRLKTLLSTLRINMVNSRFPQSKLRTKPRKKLQQLKLKQQPKPIVASPKLTSTKATPKPVPKPATSKPKSPPTKSMPKIARRHSLDLAQLLNGTRAKREQSRKNKSPEKSKSPRKAPSSHVISPNKLKSLRDKMREERERLNGTTSHKSKAVAISPSSAKTHDDKVKAAS